MCAKHKTILDFTEAREDGVLGQQRHQLDHMQTTKQSASRSRQITTPAPQFLQTKCTPDKPVKAILKIVYKILHKTPLARMLCNLIKTAVTNQSCIEIINHYAIILTSFKTLSASLWLQNF